MFWIIPSIRMALGITGSINGMLVAIIAGITAFIGWSAYVHNHGKNAGRTEVGIVIEKGAKDAGAKSATEHVAAGKPGAFDRMRNDPATCRDCNKSGNGGTVSVVAPSNNRAQ